MATIRPLILTSKPARDGSHAIYLCITSRNTRDHILLPYRIDDICQWMDGKVVAHRNAAVMNRRIALELKKYQERLDDIDNADCYTAKQLKTILTQPDTITPDVRTFNEFMADVIQRMKNDGRASYASMMEDTLKLFTRVEGDIPMIVMNHHVITHFDTWMKKNGHTDGGRQIRLCHLKARVNEAIKLGLLKCKEHPFAYTKIPVPEPREMDVSPDQVRRIMQRDVSHSKRLTLAKDMFLLSFYLGGMNFADLMRVDLSGADVGYRRQKTSGRATNKVHLSIQPDAQAIIDKYIGDDGRLHLGYNYTEKNLQCYINQCLKLLAKEVGITGTFSFYSARKSFAQMASEIGIPDAVIDYCLGHSDRGRGVLRYYTQIRQKQADAAVNRVIDYAKNPAQYKDYVEMRMDIMMRMAL